MSEEITRVEQTWNRIITRKRITYDDVLAFVMLIRNAGVSAPFVADAIDLGFGRGVVRASPGIDHNALWTLDGRRFELKIAGRALTLLASDGPDPYYFNTRNRAWYLPFNVES